MLDDLTLSVLSYQDGQMPLPELRKKISLMVYQFPQRFYGWNLERCGDFYLHFLPRIKKILDRFSYSGRPFRHFLFASLKWQIRSFMRSENEAKSLDLMAEREKLKEEEAEIPCEIPSGHLLQDHRDELERLIFQTKNGQYTPAAQRRLFYLTLKCALFVNDRMAREIACRSGLDEIKLWEALETLKNEMAPHRERLTGLKEKRTLLYASRHRAEMALAKETDPDRTASWTGIVERLKKRLEHLDQQIAQVPLSPTHAQIAKVVRAPKGTVDSGIHELKNRWKQVSQKVRFRYI